MQFFLKHRVVSFMELWLTTILQFCCDFILFYFSCSHPTLLVSLYIIIMNVYVRLSHIINITYLLNDDDDNDDDDKPSQQPNPSKATKVNRHTTFSS